MSCETATRLSCSAFQIPALCSCLLLTSRDPNRSLHPVSSHGARLCLHFFSLSQPLLVVYLLFVEFRSSTSGTTCSDVILCHLSFPDLQISGVKKESCLWPQTWECLKRVVQHIMIMLFVQLDLTGTRIMGGYGLIWCHILQMDKMLHTGIFT